MRLSQFRRLASVALALTCATMVGAGAIAPSSFAATVDPGASAYTVDKDAPVSLTILKTQSPVIGGPGDGTASSGDIGDKLNEKSYFEGVKFILYKVQIDGQDIDLTTNAGWEATSPLLGRQTVTKAEIENGFEVVGKKITLTEVASQATDEGGFVEFADELAKTLYVVAEDLQGSDEIKLHRDIDDEEGQVVNKAQVTPSRPFFVTLPMTAPEGKKWLYKVEIEPKNDVDTATKQVIDDNGYTSATDEVSKKTLRFLIAGDISDTGDINGPEGKQDGKVDHHDLQYWGMHDQLDPKIFDIETAQVELYLAKEFNPDAGRLTGGTDYRVSYAKNGAIDVALTEAGLDKTAAANATDPATKVFIDLSVSFKKDAQIDGAAVTNQAFLIPNGNWPEGHGGTKPKPPSPSDHPDRPNDPGQPDKPGGDHPDQPGNPGQPGQPPVIPPYFPPSEDGQPPIPGIPTNNTESHYGKILVKKIDSEGKTLTGAKFSLYHADAKNECPADLRSGNRLVAEQAVDDEGVVVFDNILLSTGVTTMDENGKVTTHTDEVAPGHAYCLVETQAPKGFELLAEPVKFELKADGKDFDHNAVSAALTKDKRVTDNGVAIVNLPHNTGSHLPLTGANGVIAAAVIGILLILGGTALKYYQRKKS